MTERYVTLEFPFLILESKIDSASLFPHRHKLKQKNKLGALLQFILVIGSRLFLEEQIWVISLALS